MLVPILSLLILFSAPLRAASGRAAALAPIDPRSLGMGGAGLALPGGPLALRLNPAAVSVAGPSEAAFSHLAWLGGTFQDQFAYSVAPDAGKAWSLGLGYFSVPEFDSTQGQEPAFSAGLARAELGYAQQLDGTLGGLSLGASASYLEQRMGPFALRDVGASVGAAWQSPWPFLRLGAVADQVPLYASSGNALPVELGLGLGLGSGALKGAVDCVFAPEGRAQTHLGAEWCPHPMLALRAGLSNLDAPEAAWALSTGLGLAWDRWKAGFAWQGLGALGPALLVSLGTTWGAVATRSSLKPAALNAAAEEIIPDEAVEAAKPAAKASKPSAGPPSDWISGAFELEAVTNGQRVDLSWPSQGGVEQKMAGYEVLMGMVAEAPLQKTGGGMVKEPRWSDDMAVRGMTYYFRVRVLGQGGEVLGLSRVKAVQMP